MVLEILFWLVKTFSYLGIFLVGLIATSTILFPFPIDLAMFFTPALGLHPLLVSLAVGTGAAFGELTGYYLGVGGGTIKTVKKSRLTKFFVKFFERAGFLTILITAFIPFPFDIIGILAGISKYDVRKFLLATAIGKIFKAMVIAYTGYFLLPYVGLFIGRF
jgi:membrane-associated protein